MAFVLHKPMEYQIRVDLSGGANGIKMVTLDEGQSIVIGRLTDPKEAAQPNNLKIDGKVISRKHAVLTVVDRKLCIKDTKSSSGTFINGQRLASQGEESDYIEVVNNDIILLGEDVELEGVKYKGVQMAFSIASFEGAAKKVATKSLEAAPGTPKAVSRNSFMKKSSAAFVDDLELKGSRNDLASSEPSQMVSSPTTMQTFPIPTQAANRNPSVAKDSPMASPQSTAKMLAIKQRLEKGLFKTQLSSVENEDDPDDLFSGARRDSRGEDEFSSDLIQDMNSEYDALWTTMTSNLDSKIAKYFKLAQDQADQMRDAGVFGEPDVLASLPRAMSKLKSQKKRQSVGSIKSSYSTSTNSSYATAVVPQKQ